MEWWPGKPHSPHRDSAKVHAIQRSLDWKRVVEIAAYLLQEDVVEAPEVLKKVFDPIYAPKKNDPGREWPPQVKSLVKKNETSIYPDFSNILAHVNGAKLSVDRSHPESGHLVIDSSRADLKFTIIDGQHRINGAYLALMILKKKNPKAWMQLPATVYLDLDPANGPPRHQAQIFIDVNYYQKKVDRSLVVDLFPTARGRDPLTDRERAQDIGRRLMLEVGPLVGLVQIPGIRYGVEDVVTLSTLVGSIADILDDLRSFKLETLEAQTEFLAQVFTAWLRATGRAEEEAAQNFKLDDENVVYQGRVLISVLALMPSVLVNLRRANIQVLSIKTSVFLSGWFRRLLKRAGLLRDGKFVEKNQFKKGGILGSGGIGRFRNLLWAASEGNRSVARANEKRIEELSAAAKRRIRELLSKLSK